MKFCFVQGRKIKEDPLLFWWWINTQIKIKNKRINKMIYLILDCIIFRILENIKLQEFGTKGCLKILKTKLNLIESEKWKMKNGKFQALEQLYFS